MKQSGFMGIPFHEGLFADRGEKEYIKIIKMQSKLSYRILTCVLLVSYAFTIPLLSIIHLHLETDGPNVLVVRPEARANDYSVLHPRYCDICSRLASTVGHVEVHLPEQTIILTRESIPLRDLTPRHSTFLTSLQGRAPPPLLA